jgi:hypothetical protein
VARRGGGAAPVAGDGLTVGRVGWGGGRRAEEELVGGGGRSVEELVGRSPSRGGRRGLHAHPCFFCAAQWTS